MNLTLGFSLKRWLRGKRTLSASLSATLSLAAAGASADDLVVPSALENVEGDIENCIPLTGCLDADRYQQVFDSSEFGALTEPAYITSIAFRPDGGEIAPFTSMFFLDMEINLSTTSNGPDSLSAIFDDNVGPDATTVHRGALALSSDVTGPVGGPKDFDIVINFQTPFLYDPSAGHLLIEFKNYSGEGFALTQFADAHTTFGDTTSRVYTTTGSNPGDPEALSGTVDSWGLVSKVAYFFPEQLTLENIPAPTGDNVPIVNVPNFFVGQATRVVQAGTTSAMFCVAPDPREVTKYFGFYGKKPYFIARDLHVSELSNTGSCGDLFDIDLEIPRWFRGYPGIFPADGSGEKGVWLIVAVVNSSAEFDGPIAIEPAPESLIDYTDPSATQFGPECDGPLAWRPLSLGGAVAALGEFPNVEGTAMIPESSQCNRARSLTRRTTHVYPVRLDGRPHVEEHINLQSQLDGIRDTITEAFTCADFASQPVLGLLQSSLDTARDKIAWKRYIDAIHALEQIARDASFNSNDFSGCPVAANYKGNFMSRALAAAFTVWDRYLHRDLHGWDIYLVPADLQIPLLASREGPLPLPLPEPPYHRPFPPHVHHPAPPPVYHPPPAPRPPPPPPKPRWPSFFGWWK